MDIQHINPSNHYSIAPASQAVKCGNMIYVSGQCAFEDSDRDNPSGVAALKVIHPGNLARQLPIVMDNLQKVLTECGATMDNVVKIVTYYVSDGSSDDWKLTVEERFRRFSVPGPASSAVPVPRLAAPGLMVEVEAIAVVG